MLTDRFAPGHALEGVHDQPNDIYGGEHPGPLALPLVPHQQLLDILADEDVDRLDEGDGFIDGGHAGIDGHAVVGSVVEEDFGDERFQVLLDGCGGTSLLIDWLLCRYSPDYSPD